MKKKYVKVDLSASGYWNPDFIKDHKTCNGLFEIIGKEGDFRLVKRIKGYDESRGITEWKLSKHHGPTIEVDDMPSMELDKELFEL